MAWKKSPKELTDLLEKSVKDFDCQKRNMFGFPAYFINNNMFTGTFEGNLFIRLPEEDREKILKDYKRVKIFEPMSGRPMKEYVVLPKVLYKNKKSFSKWLEKSVEYVSSLPPKEQKKRKN
jgi:TfoX/Sxy family transcriptional regulator of competence genes